MEVGERVVRTDAIHLIIDSTREWLCAANVDSNCSKFGKLATNVAQTNVLLPEQFSCYVAVWIQIQMLNCTLMVILLWERNGLYNFF